MDLRTPTEKDCHHLLLRLSDSVTGGKKLNRRDYLELMGNLRDQIRVLDNKAYGCPTGQHSGDCKRSH